MNTLVFKLLNVLAAKATRRTLNEFEAQLYEASSRYVTTILKFQDVTSQSAIIKAERDLDELQQKGHAG